MSESIYLKSSDNVVVKTSLDVVMCSGVIKTMLETCVFVEGQNIVPLPNVSSEILTKVLEWADHHKTDPDHGASNANNEPISEWDRQFFATDISTMSRIINAGNYLDIEGLIKIGCRIIADMLKGKSTVEMRQILQIEDDIAG